ncbi:MAG: pyridoxamine 5'-phosphate oxidase family protein [Acidimicrobiaceae bacterium]|nr:pyridoxamine 5'-phosphate oxidase family protein [Acidimicrobiaceae bacterium]
MTKEGSAYQVGLQVVWGTRRRALSRDECFARLAGRTTGRVAITSAAMPFISVVRYFVNDEAILFDVGLAALASKTVGQVVAFESGSADAGNVNEHWSVCAVGVAELAVEAPWKEPILRIQPEFVSGWVQRNGPLDPCQPRPTTPG